METSWSQSGESSTRKFKKPFFELLLRLEAIQSWIGKPVYYSKFTETNGTNQRKRKWKDSAKIRSRVSFFENKWESRRTKVGRWFQWEFSLWDNREGERSREERKEREMGVIERTVQKVVDLTQKHAFSEDSVYQQFNKELENGWNAKGEFTKDIFVPSLKNTIFISYIWSQK